MPLADTLNRKPGDILKSDDWNVIIKEIDRKINRDGADTLKGPLTITEALKVNSSVIISGNLSVTNVLEIGDPPLAGNTGGNRDWMQKGIKINWDSDSLFIGLKNEGTNRKDAVIAWGDDPQDDLRFVNVLAGGEVQGKELMRIKPSGNVGIGTNNPIASLDIASASRTGTHPTAVKGLYITGDFNADNDGVEFRHSSGTQGIGFGFNTIYAAGSAANQDLGLKPKGTGVIAVAGNLSVSGIVKAQALTLSQSGGQSSGMASFMSKNPESPYINWYHSRSGADQDLKRYGYIQAGDDGIKEFRFVAENGANFKFSGGNLTVSGDLSVTGSVSFGSQVRQMLNLWSTGYGIGIQNGTQYFRSDRNFAWYKGGSHNNEELNPGGGAVQMVIKDGNVGIGTTNPGTKLEINGDLKVTGTITGTIDATNIATGTLNVARIPNLSANKIIDVYDIYLRGSAFESTEGNITFLKIANFDFGLTTQRGLNTIILNPGGAYRRKANHDVYGDKTNWNNWADWVNSNAAAGDLVAVASYDALHEAPKSGSAATLLDAINGKQAFSAEYRVSYALFFIKGESKCIEVLQAYRGPNAHLKTGYAFSQLSFNFNNFNSEEAWIVPAFMNSWTNYDTTYNPAGYFKDSLGIVHLRGLVKNGTNNTTIFTLPVGYRPSNRELQAVQTNLNIIGRVDILADGQVTVVSGSNVWVSLDGITFRAGG
ncbi:hypothetical protein H6F92_20050 [Microcystis wesenbergii FACHB-1317]|uniref:hypothetical protein n=1 Tax=Microcystis TaxID=1125 RepID=UPI001680B36A|nr:MULTISPECIES: hypothetical protein [Microcystis]MBD2290948.1 hypothetical protein [Microcystis wesenbergii FACHB-1317]UZO77248.1 hypothetical protein M8120_04440 [Microcystis aeruginosa str. Chao 1910]